MEERYFEALIKKRKRCLLRPRALHRSSASAGSRGLGVPNELRVEFSRVVEVRREGGVIVEADVVYVRQRIMTNSEP